MGQTFAEFDEKIHKKSDSVTKERMLQKIWIRQVCFWQWCWWGYWSSHKRHWRRRTNIAQTYTMLVNTPNLIAKQMPTNTAKSAVMWKFTSHITKPWKVSCGRETARRLLCFRVTFSIRKITKLHFRATLWGIRGNISALPESFNANKICSRVL